MKTNTKFLRVLAVAAAVALPSHALADRHDRPGFYVGGGGHLNNAEFGFSKAFTAASNTTLTFVSSQVNFWSTSARSATTLSLNIVPTTIALTSDDKSAFGYSIHGGYRINQYFAVEGSYALLGEFSAKYAASTGTAVTATDGTNNDSIAVTMVPGTYTAEATAISGSALGTYPLADNATVFGRLGYYAVSVEESLTLNAFNVGDGTVSADGEANFAAGTATINKDVAGDTSGFLFGGGVEVKFGPKQNILVRAEFELLSDAIAEADAITRFGITGSYNF